MKSLIPYCHWTGSTSLFSIRCIETQDQLMGRRKMTMSLLIAKVSNDDLNGLFHMFSAGLFHLWMDCSIYIMMDFSIYFSMERSIIFHCRNGLFHYSSNGLFHCHANGPFHFLVLDCSILRLLAVPLNIPILTHLFLKHYLSSKPVIPMVKTQFPNLTSILILLNTTKSSLRATLGNVSCQGKRWCSTSMPWLFCSTINVGWMSIGILESKFGKNVCQEAYWECEGTLSSSGPSQPWWSFEMILPAIWCSGENT
jgi:hypothetical protein